MEAWQAIWTLLPRASQPFRQPALLQASWVASWNTKEGFGMCRRCIAGEQQILRWRVCLFHAVPGSRYGSVGEEERRHEHKTFGLNKVEVPRGSRSARRCPSASDSAVEDPLSCLFAKPSLVLWTNLNLADERQARSLIAMNFPLSLPY